jgi:hypothetical protein
MEMEMAMEMEMEMEEDESLRRRLGFSSNQGRKAGRVAPGHGEAAVSARVGSS